MIDLAKLKCVPCEGGTPPLEPAKIEEYLSDLGNDWAVLNGTRLFKQFNYPNFKEALDFVNRLGEMAESEGHHPDIELSYGRVKVTIYTHAIDGLTQSDFILAAKAQLVS